MKLYYYPGACSLAVHIALIETGLPYTIKAINHEKKTEDGNDFLVINPKGYIPALDIGNGNILTENQVILAYVAELSGKLIPGENILRWRCFEILSYMVSEIHGAYVPFFKNFSETEKKRSLVKINKAFSLLSLQIGKSDYLIDNRMTIADCYLFWILRVAQKFSIDLPENLHAFYLRVREMHSVTQALTEEGLI